MQMLRLGASLFQHLQLEQIVNDDKRKKKEKEKSTDAEKEDVGRNLKKTPSYIWSEHQGKDLNTNNLVIILCFGLGDWV